MSATPSVRAPSIQPNGTNMPQAGKRRASHRPTERCRVNYSFFSLDGAGRIVIQEERECSGDVAALVYARSLALYQTIEIWDGAFRVAHIAKGENPLKACESTSGWKWEFTAKPGDA